MRQHFCSLSALCLIVISVVDAAAQSRPGPFMAPHKSLRTREVDQQHVRVDLKLDLEQQSVVGKATHKLELFKAAKSMQLDAAEMNVGGVTLLAAKKGSAAVERRKLNFAHRNKQLIIDLPEEMGGRVSKY